MTIRLFLDSGAPSLYNKIFRSGNIKAVLGTHFKDRKHDDFSHLESPGFEEYFKAYINFIKEHEHLLDVYCNLDIMQNAEASWKNQERMEAEGLKPLPVFHLGEDLKWLKMYVEKYDYVAIGGVSPNPTRTTIPLLDAIWEDIICDPEGMPKVKIHGFAVTAPKLLFRYPWYSVDSTSWLKHGRNGNIFMPKKRNGEYVYDEYPISIPISSRSPFANSKGKHFQTISKKEQEEIIAYISQYDVKLGKSHFKHVDKNYKLEENEKFWQGKFSKDGKKTVEVIEEWGVSTYYVYRDIINIIFFKTIEEMLPEWPWAFKPPRTERLRKII